MIKTQKALKKISNIRMINSNNSSRYKIQKCLRNFKDYKKSLKLEEKVASVKNAVSRLSFKKKPI